MIALRPLISVFAIGALATVLTACSTTESTRNVVRSGSSADRISPVRAAELNTRMGVGYLEQGEPQIAMQKLLLAVQQDPEHVPAHLALGFVYESINSNDKALQHLKTAVRLAPEDGAAHNSYAALLCRVGRYKEADRHFQAALEDPFYSTPDVALANAGACARRDGRDADAEGYLREALSIDEQNRSALFNLSEMFFLQGNALQARAFLQRLESIGRLSPAALLLGYRIERALDSDQMARQYAQTIESQFPDSPQASELRQLKR
ncbi:MAG: type IV pilus biogenesis/stability protein PilW [Wenzhouxiangellaceae bacterium]|nr:type IV pilus biogenesis/stability protein PilW [Wenzhouxiangellaceae bacterium]